MIYYANPVASEGDAVRTAMDDGLLGCITTPGQGNVPRWGVWDVIADNGCFSDKWDADVWWSWLKGRPTSCRFAVCPDVADPVGGSDTHAETLERWRYWSPRIRRLGHVPAFVCQPGCGVDDVPEDAAVLFLGGDNAYKLGPTAASICAHYGQRGRWLHMGRVNSQRRLDIARSFGCDSVDGTYLTFGPDKNLPRLLSWLDNADTTPMLWETT